MFKRVAKRQRKRTQEDELGLDEEMKQVLGLQDTDSDESVDSSDSEIGNESDLDLEDEDEGEQSEDDDAVRSQNTSRKRKHSAAKDSHSDTKRIGSEEESSDDGEFMSEDDRPPMGVIAATTMPIYDIPDAKATQDLRACILCPGKLLKNVHMTKVHAESTAHLRRLQHYVAQVAKLTSSPGGLNTDDPRVILQDMALIQNSAPVRDVSSKRSQRRTAWKAERAERKKAKIQAKAEKSKEKAKEGSKASKPKKSEEESRSGPTDIPVSITADLPSKAGDHGKQSASKRESTDQDRPRKRPKYELTPGTASSANSKMETTPDAEPRPNNPSGEPRRKKPSLKRNNTSLYFADDENRSGLLNNPRRRTLSVNVDEAQHKKLSKPSSGTKKQVKIGSNGGIGHTKGLSGRGESNTKSRGLNIPKVGKGSR